MVDLGPLAAHMPPFEPGSVWLVGAGPGDPGLLTARAIFALGQADVLVYDALVAPEILSLVNPAAEREFAGKRGGKPSAKQGDITDRLIELAREGKRVLRLKGGDPFVFGRGGEEALALVAAGVPFHVVPGITSGLGGLTAAGIPATTRDTNQAVILMTGHYAVHGPEAIDWAAFARTGVPLILYMAMNNLAAIVAELVEAGMAPETPVGFVNKATTPEQRVLVSTLATCVADAAAAGIEPPTITVIGSIVPLRAALGYGDGRP
ncbi:uroporphyrinogen-III C-methyltransferase [Pinisolibacter aquiterrae]|uniref:uroporphyrinogen-III C-methyltransferase n=1 Tax=Pinisolibacter aquiterrae TaxID=2815579 RepID=UPI001C3D5994|nr:uroporphyrinogen-III C-methyltransferase [Pinisolibacter aquiterrae]MBV5264977.1 uroporphyrinogen-III C-methyltransferase [Pinisolibacter aquiterrae]MCC8235641.1 uroporphyrinogen-III C-methyltransferase [Pinisolibacter aquiterrae]